MGTAKRKVGPTRGEKYAAKVRESFALNESEDVLVDLIAGVMDRLDSEPMSLVERRQTEQVLIRAIGQLALPFADDDGSGVKRPSTTRLQAAAAARSRWNKEVER